MVGETLRNQLRRCRSKVLPDDTLYAMERRQTRRESPCRLVTRGVFAKVQHRRVSRAYKLDAAVSYGTAHNDRCKLAGYRHKPMEPNANGNWPGPCAVPFPPDTRKTG